jgi:hypothetical protein
VSSLSSHRVLSFIRVAIFFLAFFAQVTVKAWDVDLSRRDKDLQKAQGPGVVAEDPAPENLVNTFFDTTGPTQEVVILNTEKGFVPETVNLKKGGSYRIHVVNVNEKDKNVSFILDAFSEHHGTFFGQPKTFSIAPKTEGIYSFQCPETAKQGRIVVTGDESSQGNQTRKPASTK